LTAPDKSLKPAWWTANFHGNYTVSEVWMLSDDKNKDWLSNIDVFVDD